MSRTKKIRKAKKENGKLGGRPALGFIVSAKLQRCLTDRSRVNMVTKGIPTEAKDYNQLKLKINVDSWKGETVAISNNVKSDNGVPAAAMYYQQKIDVPQRTFRELDYFKHEDEAIFKNFDLLFDLPVKSNAHALVWKNLMRNRAILVKNNEPLYIPLLTHKSPTNFVKSNITVYFDECVLRSTRQVIWAYITACELAQANIVFLISDRIPHLISGISVDWFLQKKITLIPFSRVDTGINLCDGKKAVGFPSLHASNLIIITKTPCSFETRLREYTVSIANDYANVPDLLLSIFIRLQRTRKHKSEPRIIPNLKEELRLFSGRRCDCSLVLKEDYDSHSCRFEFNGEISEKLECCSIYHLSFLKTRIKHFITPKCLDFSVSNVSYDSDDLEPFTFKNQKIVKDNGLNGVYSYSESSEERCSESN